MTARNLFIASCGLAVLAVAVVLLTATGSRSAVAGPTATPSPTPPHETRTPTPTPVGSPSVTPTRVPTTPGPGTRMIADLNCDGSVDRLDVLMELKEIALLGPIECGLELGGVSPFDLDCNGVLQLPDMIELIHFVAHIPYPVPTPTSCLPLDTFVATTGGK